MSGNNLYSRFAFKIENGKVDNATRAFLSKFSGRMGAAIPDIAPGDSWPEIAQRANAIIAEMTAQGWLKRNDGSAASTSESAYANAIRAVTMIPAATEWGYAPYEVLRDQIVIEEFFVTTENAYSVYPEDGVEPNLSDARTLTLETAKKYGRVGNMKCDWKNSLDRLKTALPNAKLVNLFVSWYGDDLRCGQCQIYPGVTRKQFVEHPHSWSVNGVARQNARLISSVNGQIAYGGTPDDKSFKDCIADLKARGHEIAFTPFLLMDIPANNGRQDPYTGGTHQQVLPWRGRITKAYATADKTAAVATEVAAFVSQYNAFVLHYANLCAEAGGVDVFVIGTELRGLTWLRSAASTYPFVTALKTLAASVRAILPAAKITYAADWSEYFGHQPGDGSGDVYFHLDDLWADENIDAISIDNYFPLSDWRDGTSHLDYVEGRTIYDAAYLQANIRGGEGYDWFYANDANRTAQTRTTITDGAYGKPWVFRYKDLWNWWGNAHYNRPGGVESGTTTAWVPESKPIWFTELGTPSVDKGTNQPNVFYDPKSSESFFPYFSSGERDYAIQRAGVNAVLQYFDPNAGGFVDANNPQSSVYSGRMVDHTKIMIYTWDARPFPAFPLFDDIWSDAANWPFGHWLDGKIFTYGNSPQTGLGALDQMAVSATYAPRHPFIVDPATGQLDKQYKDFFEAIEFNQANAIANVPAVPTASEAATAINAILAVLRAQKRIAP